MSDQPHPFDAHVGRRISIRRAALGLSQSALAVRIGVSFQQVQKYETGANRISASRLMEVSRVLEKPFGFWAVGYGDASCETFPPEDRSLAVAAHGATPVEIAAACAMLKTLASARAA